ncbi:MAG: endonuclease NucS [Meiothermus sp.]|nr:endonuclease NucS [Meiothermus sp.]
MPSHFVLVRNTDGSVGVEPLKQWLRENPEHIPSGLDATASTTYQLRRALVRRHKWVLEQTPDHVYLIKPDDSGDTSYADEYLENVPGTESVDEEQIVEAAEITFGLERDMQQALRSRIDQLEPGLIIADGGRERNTEAGRIDITARDSRGNVVIIELKAGLATPDVIPQVLSYMGAVAETDNLPVRGILVASEFHRRVIWAARAIPNLQLRKYTFQFRFEAIQ